MSKISEMEWMDMFGDNLRYILEQYGYTQEQFADAIGVSKGTVSRYINKQIMPSLKCAINMSLELGIEMDDLFLLNGDRIY